MISTDQQLSVDGVASAQGHALSIREYWKCAAHGEDCILLASLISLGY